MLKTSSKADEKGVRRELEEYILNFKLYNMLFASLCMVGCCSTFIYHLDQILFLNKNALVNLNTYYSTTMLCQFLGAFVMGLIAYFLRNKVNEYIVGIVGCVLAIIGFLLCLFAKLFEPSLMFYGAIVVSVALGIWWIMPPLIAYDDAGPKPFGVLFAFILLANWWGMSAFGFMFKILWESVTNPYIYIMVINIIGCVGGIVGCVAALFMDEK